MSTENHPNFHAVNFVTAVIQSCYASIRGRAGERLAKWNDAPDITGDVTAFVQTVENKVDKWTREYDDAE